MLAGRACRAGAARPARGSLPGREAAFPGVDLMPPAARSDNCEERGSRAGPRSIRPRREAIDDDSVCGEGAKGADLIEPHQVAVALTSAAKIAASFRSTECASNPGISPITIARPDARSERL